MENNGSKNPVYYDANNLRIVKDVGQAGYAFDVGIEGSDEYYSMFIPEKDFNDIVSASKRLIPVSLGSIDKNIIEKFQENKIESSHVIEAFGKPSGKLEELSEIVE